MGSATSRFGPIKATASENASAPLFNSEDGGSVGGVGGGGWVAFNGFSGGNGTASTFKVEVVVGGCEDAVDDDAVLGIPV